MILLLELIVGITWFPDDDDSFFLKFYSNAMKNDAIETVMDWHADRDFKKKKYIIFL